MRFKILGVLCFAVLCVTLSLGLWPFRSPKNDVTWLKRGDGIFFGRYGTVLSSANPETAGSFGDGNGSIEIWAQPDRWSSGVLLALYRPEPRLWFVLRQSLTDLELQAESDASAKRAQFYVNDAFGPALRRKKPLFITVTTGLHGTMVYLDGALTKAVPQFRLPVGASFSRLIVGDAPIQPDSFQGAIRGVAMYSAELNATQALNHYRSWTGNRPSAVAEDKSNFALYLFDEHNGNAIHNRATAGQDLYIPETYSVVDKVALEPFWKAFDFSGSYWSGNFKNVVGFIPLGFCFCAYFAMARAKRPALVAVLSGLLVSLTIEIVQAFLPTRDSGTTDLITNTLGSYVGVLCYRTLYPVVANRFPWLDWFAAPRG